MKRLFHSRYFQIVAIVFVLMSILLIRLFVLTVLQNDQWSEAAENLSTKTIYTSAPRGEILDRNGKVLAGNQYTVSVRMSRGNRTDELTNHTILQLIYTLEKNGDQAFDNFPIKIAANNTLYYEKNTDRQTFLSKFGITEKLSAKEAFVEIRRYFKVDSSLSTHEARKILVVRNEMASLGYKKYIPVVVAKDISNASVAQLEEDNAAYPGVEVFSQVSRHYPNNNTASHILGYLGKISDSERQKYVEELGYQPSDLIGKEGIEKVYESVLKGTDGTQKVQVNAAGNLVKELEKTEAQKGRDVVLTVDSDLQKTAEEALEKSLSAIRSGGGFTSKYGNHGMKAAPNAEVGAAVALDVKTGEVLAMASCPDFDPNLFTGGITTKDWQALQSSNPRNPLAPAPLYNVAAKSAVQPGSTFKMVTATAALECGLDPSKRLYDNGYIKFGNSTFGCVVWNLFGDRHGYLNLQEALEVSCNYYFYDAATGRDFYTGNGLGYKKEISVDTIMDYARQYGLGQPTGIEIPETVAPTPSAQLKIDQLKASLKNTLLAKAETYFTSDVTNYKEKLNETVETISNFVGTKLTREETAAELEKGLGVKSDRVEELADLCQYSYINQATWNTGDALNIAIGQGANSYTPLQMANYAATLGNRGIKNPVSIVKKAGGSSKDKKEPEKVKVSSDSYFDEIIGGMVKVANGSGGSLTRLFQGFPVTVAGKTGTAERAGKINPPDEVAYIKEHLGGIAPYLAWSDIEAEMNRLMDKYPDIYTNENTAVRRAVIHLSKGKVTTEKIDRYKPDYDNFAWVITLAPADDPQIAVAVMIAQGGTAANAGPAAREILGKYFEKQAEE